MTKTGINKYNTEELKYYIYFIILHSIICKPNSTPKKLLYGLLNVKTLCDSFLHSQGLWFAYFNIALCYNSDSLGARTQTFSVFGETRTLDPSIKSALRYQLRYEELPTN